MMIFIFQFSIGKAYYVIEAMYTSLSISQSVFKLRIKSSLANIRVPLIDNNGDQL